MNTFFLENCDVMHWSNGKILVSELSRSSKFWCFSLYNAKITLANITTHQYHQKILFFPFLKVLLKCRWFTILWTFLLYNKVIQLYMDTHPFFFIFFSHKTLFCERLSILLWMIQVFQNSNFCLKTLIIGNKYHDFFLKWYASSFIFWENVCQISVWIISLSVILFCKNMFKGKSKDLGCKLKKLHKCCLRQPLYFWYGTKCSMCMYCFVTKNIKI